MTVLDWLLDSDPALHWQVLRDLTDAPPDVIAGERARTATQGWGARLLARQGADGQWAGGACFPGNFRGDFSSGQPWTSTLPTLALLRELGVDPLAEPVRARVAMAAQNCRWEYNGEPFFAGEVEPCINGRTVAVGAYFGFDVRVIVDRLIGEQLPDGGWNCEAQNGSVRSSFHSTICVLEGLSAYDQATGGSSDTAAARGRAEQYLLQRRLFRSLTTGEVVDAHWLQFSFPTWWHYDVLWALDYFRAAGSAAHPQLTEAIDLVVSKQQPDGTWLLENTHPGAVHFPLEDGDGAPSRWNTLRALRVLQWFQHSPRNDSGAD